MRQRGRTRHVLADASGFHRPLLKVFASCTNEKVTASSGLKQTSVLHLMQRFLIVATVDDEAVQRKQTIRRRRHPLRVVHTNSLPRENSNSALQSYPPQMRSGGEGRSSSMGSRLQGIRIEPIGWETDAIALRLGFGWGRFTPD